MDGDGSFDPAELPALLAAVAGGRCDLALGPPTPGLAGRLAVARPRWATRWSCGGCGGRSGFPVHDLAPMRVCRRQDLLDLDVRDRRFGYPLELLRKAHRWRAGGSRSTTSPTGRAPPGTRVEGERQPPRHDAHRPRLLEGAPRRRPGHEGAGGRQGAGARAGEDPARRRGRHGGGGRAGRRRAPRHPRRLPVGLRTSATSRSTATSATRSARTRCERSLTGWTVHRAARRRASGSAWRTPMPTLPVPGPTVQVGMDTPQLTAGRPARGRAGRRPAATPSSARPRDGGWWVLALSDPSAAAALAGVPMSQPDTFARTRAGADRGRPDRPGRARAHRRRHRRRRGAGGAARSPEATSSAPGESVTGMTTLPLASVYTTRCRAIPAPCGRATWRRSRCRPTPGSRGRTRPTARCSRTVRGRRSTSAADPAG